MVAIAKFGVKDDSVGGRVAQLARAHALHAWGCWFESNRAHHLYVKSFGEIMGLPVPKQPPRPDWLYWYLNQLEW